MLDVLDERGLAELIRRIRATETAGTDEDRQRYERRGKQSDEATAVLLDPATAVTWLR